jgi:hypothetical protein
MDTYDIGIEKREENNERNWLKKKKILISL